MLTLIIQKIIHKKWMVLCLLIGNILLVSVAVSYPMYRTASFQRMLTDEFDAYLEDKGTWPAMVTITHSRGRHKESFSYERIMEYVEQVNHQFQIPIKREIQFLSIALTDAEPVVKRDERMNRQMRVSAMTDLAEHVILYAGRLPQGGLVNNEYLEVMVEEEMADSLNILLDEVYELQKTSFLDGNPLRIKVVGMYRAANENDPYWVQKTDAYLKDAFIDMDTFLKYFTGEEAELAYGLKKVIYEQWDYEQIEPSQIAGILKTTDEIVNVSKNGTLLGDNAYEGIIENYSAKAKRIEASLLILQVPVFAFLLAFIYMISSQMLTMEQSEISVMKSRGAKGRQIVGMYMLQNLILCGVALLIGVPLGKGFCMLLGTATDFMEFSGKRMLQVEYSLDVVVYAMGAVLLTMIITILPVLQYSKMSIVHLKQSKAAKKVSLWKRIGLDFICLAISMYGYFSFSKNQDTMMEQVLTGESLDPLLYLSSSLFLFGFGLLALRLQPIVLKLLYSVGRKRMSPAPYVSFIEAIRGGKSQEFIMLFMILTVALGIHNTTVARTIVANAERNTTYINGADVVVREVWRDNAYTKTSDEPLEYYEPDYGRYTVLEGIKSTTKVLRQKVEIRGLSKPVTVLGIHTSEFYEVAHMPDELLPYDFSQYLNVLASAENAVLLSENFMMLHGYALGDTIELPKSEGGKVRCKIVGFFPYWPSYEPTNYDLNSDGSLKESEQLMVVANLSLLQREWISYPYEVWMKVDTGTNGLYRFVEENPNVYFTKFRDLDVLKEEIRNDTLFQGTNGILTMSFIVVLLLCGVGYLIYFILSIRSRELLFGVLRAMGMRKMEVTQMLLMEQIFCGFYAILAGTGIGLLGASLFVPMIQNAYAASDQVLPLQLITQREDLLRLFGIIGIVMLVCLFVLTRIVAHLNITKALKLGED